MCAVQPVLSLCAISGCGVLAKSCTSHFRHLSKAVLDKLIRSYFDRYPFVCSTRFILNLNGMEWTNRTNGPEWINGMKNGMERNGIRRTNDRPEVDRLLQAPDLTMRWNFATPSMLRARVVRPGSSG